MYTKYAVQDQATGQLQEMYDASEGVGAYVTWTYELKLARDAFRYFRRLYPDHTIVLIADSAEHPNPARRNSYVLLTSIRD